MADEIRGTAVSSNDHRYTPEALKGADGQEVPVTLEFGGPVIGKATLKFDPSTGNLEAEMTIDDPAVKQQLETRPRNVFDNG